MKASAQKISQRLLTRSVPRLSRDRYMKKMRIADIHNLAGLNFSPKKIPDIVGIIIDEVVISRVMCIGPHESDCIL